MSFEIIFITENSEANPAAEIQFKGQRLCVIRFSAGAPQLELLQDLYVGRNVEMVFPVADFNDTVRQAVAGLASWLENLSNGPAEA